MSDERVPVSLERAKEMLPSGDHVHTFRTSAPGFLLGADWERQDLIETIEKYGCELSGPMAAKMDHGLVLCDSGGMLFIETKSNKEDKNADRSP